MYRCHDIGSDILEKSCIIQFPFIAGTTISDTMTLCMSSETILHEHVFHISSSRYNQYQKPCHCMWHSETILLAHVLELQQVHRISHVKTSHMTSCEHSLFYQNCCQHLESTNSPFGKFWLKHTSVHLFTRVQKHISN